jgi:hypothetical protein
MGVTLTVGGTDVTNRVLAGATFDQGANATPGTCEFILRDLQANFSTVTGAEIVLSFDGTPLWGGYVTWIGRRYPFSADKVSLPYGKRLWYIRGVDYNILLDKRVIRNTANYLRLIDSGLPLATTPDGQLLRTLLSNYVDLTGFDVTSKIDDITTVGGSGNAIWQQGKKIRDVFEQYAMFSGAVYWIGPDKKVHWHAYETVEHPWGFSDNPNNGTLTNDPGYQGVTIGFRDGEVTQDGSVIVNDAFVWGGSEWAQGTVFARRTDSTSVATHGRWQYAETRFGELAIQSAVDARADAIVFGPPGADALGQQKGLRYPQWQASLTWHAFRVPKQGGVPKHILPGFLVTLELTAFGTTIQLPARSIRYVLPFINETGQPEMEIHGSFSLRVDDPWTLWRYLLTSQQRIKSTVLAVVTNSSTTTTYGAIGRFTPSPAPDGSTVVFTVPFGYIPGTGNLYLNGLIQRPGVDWVESDPQAGKITLTSPPVSTDNLYFVCRTLAS